MANKVSKEPKVNGEHDKTPEKRPGKVEKQAPRAKTKSSRAVGASPTRRKFTRPKNLTHNVRYHNRTQNTVTSQQIHPTGHKPARKTLATETDTLLHKRKGASRTSEKKSFPSEESARETVVAHGMLPYSHDEKGTLDNAKCS